MLDTRVSVIPYLADISNADRIRSIFNEHKPEVVFHAAAYKHVPVMERNPSEAVWIGKEMRAAVLHLAFAGLGAIEAHTSAFEDNPASQGVTRALGYEPNGSRIDDREGAPARHLEYVLRREVWAAAPRTDIVIEGLAPCLALLGLGDRTGPATPR
jgi:hypothetical protein